LDASTTHLESPTPIDTTPILYTISDDAIIQLEEGTHPPDSDEIIDTTYFELRVPPVTNSGHVAQASLSLDDISPGELIHDHEQYLSYNS
jgi:hypothetical protein